MTRRIKKGDLITLKPNLGKRPLYRSTDRQTSYGVKIGEPVLYCGMKWIWPEEYVHLFLIGDKTYFARAGAYIDDYYNLMVPEDET